MIKPWKKMDLISERVYDASCISCFLSCPRKFYWRYVREIVSKEESPALLFGKVVHDALLTWYENHEVMEALECLTELPTMMSGKAGDERRTREHAEVIIKEYTKKYPTEPYLIKQQEVEFHLEMLGGSVYSGRIDQLVDWNGQVFVKDHKTTSALGQSFFRSFRPSVQMDGYCYACRELTGLCGGVIINGISVASNPKERFQRDVQSRTNAEMDGFSRNFVTWTNDIAAVLDAYNREGLNEIEVWMMNYTSCHEYFTKCPYWELCVYGEDEKTIETMYKKVGEQV